MQKIRWSKIEEIFSLAIALPENDRPEFVKEKCGDDIKLCREVLDLLWEDENNGDFLSEPLFTAGLQAIDADFTELLKQTTFAHYKLLKLLGRGGMGMVFLAEDTRLKRRVALKIIVSFSERFAQINRFQREARAASNISHPNVAHIYEFGQHEKYYFLAMEFVDGKTLRERLKEQTLDKKQAVEIALQIAAALDAAHRNGITHRDIKPENIVVTEDGLVKVLDFGLAKMNEENISDDSSILETSLLESSPEPLIGTTAYMSPEQARGQKSDSRTDLWSLGVVLYEMLTAHRPFEGETSSDVIAAILKREISPQTDFGNEELKKIVLKALQKNRVERYQKAEEMRDALKKLKNQFSESSIAGLIESKDFNAPRKGRLNSVKEFRYVFSVIIILLATAGFGFWFFSGDSLSETGQIESIAILPFVNESGDETKEYLADGITELLINRLSQLPNLTVKARNSVFHYKGKPVDLKTAGRNLSVQAVLLGRVSERGENLILNLELVDIRTGNQVWGEQYNRKSSDLILLQNEIVQDVSEKLRKRLSGAETRKLIKNYTENAEAYKLYLRGRFHWSKRTAKDLQKSVEYFEQAIAVDPNFALAYSGMADAYVLFSGFGINSPNESFPKAKQAAQKALELDETLTEAHTALSYALFNYDWNFEESERQIKRAIELNPNYATAHHWNGNANLLAAGKFDEAIASVKRAHELDPLSLIISADLATAYLYAGRFDEAEEQYKKTIEMDGNFYYARAYLGRTYLMKGEYQKALKEYQIAQTLADDPRISMLRACTYSKLGERNEALKMLAKLNSEAKTKYISPYYFALIYANLGDKDKAFEWLEKAYREREGRMTLIKVDALLNNLRTDPRFSDLLKRLKLENN